MSTFCSGSTVITFKRYLLARLFFQLVGVCVCEYSSLFIDRVNLIRANQHGNAPTLTVGAIVEKTRRAIVYYSISVACACVMRLIGILCSLYKVFVLVFVATSLVSSFPFVDVVLCVSQTHTIVLHFHLPLTDKIWMRNVRSRLNTNFTALIATF